MNSFQVSTGARAAGRSCCGSCSKGRIKDLLELCDSMDLLRIDLRAFLSLLLGGGEGLLFTVTLSGNKAWPRRVVFEGLHTCWGERWAQSLPQREGTELQQAGLEAGRGWGRWAQPPWLSQSLWPQPPPGWLVLLAFPCLRSRGEGCLYCVCRGTGGSAWHAAQKDHSATAGGSAETVPPLWKIVCSFLQTYTYHGTQQSHS